MTTELAIAVYSILEKFGGASANMQESFIHHHVNNNCDEWRFEGMLGFGGKYRSRTHTVDCYFEDMTVERRTLITSINEKLAQCVNQNS